MKRWAIYKEDGELVHKMYAFSKESVIARYIAHLHSIGSPINFTVKRIAIKKI